MDISTMTSAEQRVFCERVWNGSLMQANHLNYFNDKGISCKGRAAKDENLAKRRDKLKKQIANYLKQSSRA